MPLLANWFVEKHISLAANHRSSDQQYCAHCGTIVFEAAKLLLTYQGTPQIYAITGKIREDGSNETLIPLRYGGKVSWDGHQIAVANGVVYDPLLESPVLFEDYAREAFGAAAIVVDDVMSITTIQETLARMRIGQDGIAIASAPLSERLRPNAGRSRALGGYILQDGHKVWPIITDRDYEYYINELELINQRQKGRFPVPLPKFDKSKILIGEQSLLSIGEGTANFISSLVSQRASLGLPLDSIGNIYAIDAAYTAANADPRFFHRQLLQNLEVADSAGNRILFDEVVSSWSLNFILEEASLEQTVEILEQVLKNLKPGGTLRFWPGIIVESNRPIVQILEKKGLIKDWWLGSYQTVLQKTGP